MSTQALARKWRPREFSALVGQDHVVRALSNALQSQRLHHAYLFTGTRGVGKTTLARILAKALNCIGPDGRGGVTPTPCNQCAACTAIDAGRFVDYVEMDAASNRGVEEMTQLLERAAYAPGNARFKVYTIDEVHMLSSHAFNAMLKTLEEPPDYVKFILATTDPQKIPVTVLSRCLQFNLKQVPPALIAARLAQVLENEGLAAPAPPLRALALAARGSMRDALSLLDQAIVYSAGAPSAETVQQMLGAIDNSVLVQLLDAVADGDAAAVLELAGRIGERGLAYSQALRDLASLLHKVALWQGVPEGLDEDADAAQIRRLGARLTREQVQLYYQIALHGRNDLSLAPDEYAGFTMTLLRMLAFTPEAAPPAAAGRSAALRAAAPKRTSASARTAAAPGDAQAAPLAPPPAAASSTSASGAPGSGGALDWPGVAAALKLSGLARELALRSELVAQETDRLVLRVPTKALLDGGNEARLRAALREHFGRAIGLAIELGPTAGADTAASRNEQERALRQKQAEDAIRADPVVRELIDSFGARLDPGTIRPVTPEG
jgi:DNA polymerase-3 subunit gamma/tau